MNRSQKMILVLILMFGIVLRFVNLGYSDYIGDEHKAFLIPLRNQSTYNFLMNQRKGPMQFFVSYIPYIFTHNWNNELLERIPFSLASLTSIYVFFIFIKKVSKDTNIALVAAFLYTVNGFTTGFGRIAQYQNLNLLFNFLSLYFYASLINNKSKLLRDSMLGTIFFCLSVLSHWDAVFILPVILWFFISFLRNSEFSLEYKKSLFLHNLLVGSILLIPYLIPYVTSQYLSTVNTSYFTRRVEIGYSNDSRYIELFNLYNPFLTLPLLSIFAAIGVINFRKTWPYALWFGVTYFVFEFFVRKPGTHIYNFVLPLIILAAYGIVYSYIKFHYKFLRQIFSLAIFASFVFLFYQAYVVYVDHTVEYPWQRETFLNFGETEVEAASPKGNTRRKKVVRQLITPQYSLNQKLPLFGFPLRRDWNAINNFVNNQNEINNEQYRYISNEAKTISEWYMDAGYGIDGGFYTVGIIRPLSFVQDYRMVQFGKGKLVYTYTNENRETVVKIYKVSR